MDPADEAAGILLAARRDQRPIAALPAAIAPTTRDGAYRIQHRVSRALGPVGGWKTAPAKDGVPFNWAAIARANCLPDGATVAVGPLWQPDLELELGLLLAADLPPRVSRYTVDDITRVIGAFRVCFEVLASRFVDRTVVDPLSVAADAQNAWGVVVGSGTDFAAGLDAAALSARMALGGEVLTRTGGHPLEPVLEACATLADEAGEFGGLRAGQVIITGARLGPIRLTTNCSATGSLGGIGEVTACFRVD